MGISRRAFVTSALAAAPAAALVTSVASTSSAAPATRAVGARAVGDVVGRITTGYQGWFAARGDQAPIDGWWHWSANWSQPPSPTNHALMSWPDMREYSNVYPTAFADLGGGGPATVFSSHDDQTVDVHFRWMREYGIDTAALQRFNPNGSEGPTRDDMAEKVRAAAETHGIKYYIMYDVTAWDDMQEEVKADWTAKMRSHIDSPAYAMQDGKPVVGIWGFGFNEPNKTWPPEVCQDVIDWFHAQDIYVMGGVPTHWRTGTQDSRPGFIEVYRSLDMLSPWMVGRLTNLADIEHFYQHVNTPDQAECDEHGMDYQPCVIPGDNSRRHRLHGDFMWRQFYNLTRIGVQGLYISMFDEYNEANQIAKTAETQADIPTDSGFLALDEDGTFCTSDYYLRLTGDGGRMFRGEIPLTEERFTPPGG
ncbi:glycoside hydrolase family 71/99-like protein [Streptomyces sp. NBRC 109706]|uniref:glycoside hydrolase family 71/99-like protein n=1 Tax=Streptomyces sp. NBRC 109706 TaxID=1550035 RepID=UPI0007829C48|nr:glycoside hydrolase family 71/99-like protein [Streptomyces sp. NBRC 109706]